MFIGAADFGGAPSVSVLGMWHAFAAGKLGEATALLSGGRGGGGSGAQGAGVGGGVDGGGSGSGSERFAAAVGACLGLALPRCSDPEARVR